ncbi:hypothetical protein K9M59_03200 [Candidatus Gracilibacteria bacterium]|nr:hypothetical protein [Candidatus Gracilibacteria bacterium]MCF7819337.1 hypothetical protein [Candidatus Gracilibacteria bacterium]
MKRFYHFKMSSSPENTPHWKTSKENLNTYLENHEQREKAVDNILNRNEKLRALRQEENSEKKASRAEEMLTHSLENAFEGEKSKQYDVQDISNAEKLLDTISKKIGMTPDSLQNQMESFEAWDESIGPA